MNPMKNRICNYFWKRKLFTLPYPADIDEREMSKLKTLPMSGFEPEFIRKFDLFFESMAERLEVKVWNGMNFTGKIVGSLISNLVESLNANQMLELDFAWKQMIENEFVQLLKVQNASLKKKFRDLENKLPMAN